MHCNLAWFDATLFKMNATLKSYNPINTREQGQLENSLYIHNRTLIERAGAGFMQCALTPSTNMARVCLRTQLAICGYSLLLLYSALRGFFS